MAENGVWSEDLKGEDEDRTSTSKETSLDVSGMGCCISLYVL